MSCITEILKQKGDKEVFIPEGNWIAVEGGGVYKDYEYLIVLNTNGHRCGYVALPPEHPYSATPEEEVEHFGRPYKEYNYNNLDIACHGGLTFMSPSHRLKETLTIPCSDMWIGFDCGHLGDSSDVEAIRKYYGEAHAESRKSFYECFSDYGSTVKNFRYAELECESIIEQLIKVAA